MRLCLVTHRVVKGDGQGRVNYEVVWETIRRGYKVILLATEVSPELQHHPQVQWVEISVRSLPTALLKNLLFARKTAQWLRQHNQEFDVLQVNGAITSFPSDVNAVHFVHTAWVRSPFHPWHQSRSLHSLYQWIYNWLNAHWEKQAFQRTRHLVAVSNTIQQELLSIGVASDEITTIENGVDLQEFFPGQYDRTLLQLPQNAVLSLFVGDIRTNRKNLDSILYALQKVPGLHLVIVGKLDSSPYPKLAESLGLIERVHFLGYRQNVPDIMRAVDFFVFPSRYEPFGMVITEAMASGLPVITSKSTGAAHLVTAECGFTLSHPNDVEALASAMQTLSSDRSLRQQFGCNARLVAEQYGWSTVSKRYVDLFETLNQASSGQRWSPADRRSSTQVTGSLITNHHG